jgi:serine/threonine protein kinase
VRAQVYQGIDIKTGETVAVKIITLTRFNPASVAQSELKVLNSAANEVRIMRRLGNTLGSSRESKYIMQMRNALVEYDAALGTLSIFIVLELLAGGELFDRIVEKKKYSEADAASLFRGMVAAVRGTHRAGVIHRDLKPENWCFSSTKETATLKLTDFGLSWDMERRDLHERMVVGSPGYIAPEVGFVVCVCLFVCLPARPREWLSPLPSFVCELASIFV